MNVAELWWQKNQDDFNPFEDVNGDFSDLQNSIKKASKRRPNHGDEGSVAEDGWYDYADGINTIEKEEEVERHGDKFDSDAYDKLMSGHLEKKEEEIKVEKISPFVLPEKEKSIG